MKGIIFNLVEEVVTQDQGVDAWEDLLDEAHVQGAYSAVGSYMDEELDRLVLVAGAAKLGVTPTELLRYIGRSSIPLLKDRYPEFFDIPRRQPQLPGVTQRGHPPGGSQAVHRSGAPALRIL